MRSEVAIGQQLPAWLPGAPTASFILDAGDGRMATVMLTRLNGASGTMLGVTILPRAARSPSPSPAR